MPDDKKTILLYHKDRYTLEGRRATDRYMRKHLNCNWLVGTNWETFLKKLDNKPDLIGLNAEILEEPNFHELLATLRTLMRSKNLNVPIAIGILPTTTREKLDDLIHYGILGILPAARYYGEEEAARHWAKLLNHEPNWPQDLIDRAPRQQKNTKPIVVVFRHEDAEIYLNKYGACMAEFDDCEFQLHTVYSFKKLGNTLQLKPSLIVVDEDMIKRYGSFNEFMLMYETLVKYAEISYKPNLSICVTKNTTVEEIKEYQRSGILGICPMVKDFGLDESKKSLIEMSRGNPYWPKHIIDQLPGSKPFSKKLKDFHLTDRQRQVFELIANRGLSNKQIATVLRISESTVKIHVSAVMKTMCVRNRTQLALTAK